MTTGDRFERETKIVIAMRKERQFVQSMPNKTWVTDTTYAALKDALRARKPAAGLIVHSDRGSQFASNKFRDALMEADAFSSMSGGQLLRQCLRRVLFHPLKGKRSIRSMSTPPGSWLKTIF